MTVFHLLARDTGHKLCDGRPVKMPLPLMTDDLIACEPCVTATESLAREKKPATAAVCMTIESRERVAEA